MKQRNRNIFWITAGGVTAVIIAALVFLFIGSTPNEAIVLIPKGATERQVKDTLIKAYGEAYTENIFLTAKAMGKNISNHPGRYEMGRGTSRFMLVWRMARGRQNPVKFTINNLRTRSDILKAISKHFAFSAADMDSALMNPTLLDKYNLTVANADALFLDNTFEAYWTDTPSKVLSRIGNAYNDFWTSSRKTKASELGLSPAEVIIIASIVEEESSKKDEYGKIGRLYINRLQKGMRLQADPTVKFALNDFSIRRINRHMLQYESEYNTYRVEGLPPGPIRTVEPATVKAILDSEPHDFLYMCANPDFSGYHIFATNYSDHMDNAANYSKELDRRGIK